MIVAFRGWRGRDLAFRVTALDVMGGEVPEQIGTVLVGAIDGCAFRGALVGVEHGQPGEPSLILVRPRGELGAGTVSVQWVSPEDDEDAETLRGRILASRDGTAVRLQIERQAGLTAEDIAAGARALTAGERSIPASISSWSMSGASMVADVAGLDGFLASATVERA